MMTCAEAKNLLNDYYDDECTPDLREDVRRHLSGCAACQNRLDEWVALSTRLFAARERPAPAFLWTRVLAAIQAQEAARPAPWWLQWRWMSRVTMAISLLVSLGSFYLYSQSALPLDFVLEGRSNQQHAIQVASSVSTPGDTAALIVGGDSWARK